MILSDTDCVIDYIHKRVTPSGLFMRSLMADELVISAITAYELMFGAQQRGRSETEAFIERVRVLPLTGSAAIIAAAHAARLAAAGTPLAVQDLLIAGVALDGGLSLITRNVRHFERIEGLALESPN
ncbi:MAG: type II toxin-antitoxin system VapC family toxin [Dehalococcoidia bacterium]|jgi:predicted nucleic acid-binding protein